MNTRIDYLYRDGSNYKKGGRAILAGPADDGQIEEILAAMDRDLGSGPASFIPGQVGLEDLQGGFATASGQPCWDDEVDHPWHEVTSIEITDEAPTVAMSVAGFLERLRAVAWDPGYRPEIGGAPGAEEISLDLLARAG